MRLVESQRRKCAFLERVLRRGAGSRTRSVVCARAEEWREGLGGNDVVVARALAPQPVVLEYAAPLLRLGGHARRLAGARAIAEEEAAALRGGRRARAASASRSARVEPVRRARATITCTSSRRCAATPERFPRRAGMARKRPLGR